MEDKILHIKRKIKQIIKSKGLTRVEKYDLVKEKSKELSKKELRILLNECQREYVQCDLIKGIIGLINTGLTGIGLIIAFSAIYFEGKPIEAEMFNSVLGTITSFLIFSVISIVFVYIYQMSKMNTLRYMLDILEEYCKK